jgi:hypothetical protein
MTVRSIAACAVLLATVGCAGQVPTGPTSVAGQYALTGFEGSRNLPCCRQTDSSGTVVTIAGGGLQIGWNTPTGTYEWDVVRKYDYANGTSQQVQSRFSAGTYTWDGQTLTLVDSAGRVPMTGAVTGGILIVRTQDHQYEFLKLIQMPH